MAAPDTFTVDAAERLDAMTPDLGVETGALVNIAPPPPDNKLKDPNQKWLVPGAPGINTESNKVSKVRVQTSQVLDPVAMGLVTLALLGATAQAYHISANPVYVGVFGLGSAFSIWKLLEIRAEALLDLDDTR